MVWYTRADVEVANVHLIAVGDVGSFLRCRGAPSRRRDEQLPSRRAARYFYPLRRPQNLSPYRLTNVCLYLGFETRMTHRQGQELPRSILVASSKRKKTSCPMSSGTAKEQRAFSETQKCMTRERRYSLHLLSPPIHSAHP
jgi:hypothetical protein